MKRAYLTMGLVIVLIGSACPIEAGPPRQLKFSVVGSINTAWYKGAIRFADLIRERTRGKLVVTVYPDAQLAGGNQVKELQMLREGRIDFTYHSTLLYSNLDKRFFAISLPWIFSSLEDVDRFLTSPTAQDLLNLTSDYGIVGLAYGENGFRQLTNSKREIQTPGDMKGLHIRVPPAPMYLSIFRVLGAEPSVMNFAAVYKALQEGIIDGQENPIDVIVAHRFYHIQKYLTLWGYSYDATILGVNKNLYDSLDSKTREILRRSAIEASSHQIQLTRGAAKTQIDYLENNGMVVTRLTTEQVHTFRKKMEPIYAEYEPVLGKDMIDAIRSSVQ